ncbi:MAG: hypothetical protein ACO23H_12015 [Alphaproteobacteria bacterium]
MKVKNVIQMTIRMVQDYFDLHHVDVGFSFEEDLMGTDMDAVLDRHEKDWFTIELNPAFCAACTEGELVRVVSHEMVHVNQYVNDGLNLDYDLFRGRKYKNEDYWFKPWEVEARGYEMAFLGFYNENWEKYCE